jgi:thymidylate kinase
MRTRLRSRPPSRSRARTVALVGADGAGKSTISQMLEREPLPFPVKRVYMGVNLESSSMMLPTTRLLLAAKRARGRSPDLVAEAAPAPSAGRRGRRWQRHAKDAARLTVWMLEEWLRQLAAAAYTRRGYLVVFDRHFYADYYHSAIAPAGAPDPVRRLHGWTLQHAYPKPGLVICLDAPGEVLYARKHEASADWLEHRRRQYLGLADVVPVFAVVDADRPLSAVFADVVEVIRDRNEGVVR